MSREASIDIRSQPYTALSHCWGAVAGHLVTMTANLKQMIRGIPIEEIPKTYIDAFEITRSLGVRYIWIDALCIIQDDPEDWQLESAKMCDIYRNAYYTIAASAAASNDHGCFIGQQTPSVPIDGCPLTVDGNGRHSNNYSATAPAFLEKSNSFLAAQQPSLGTSRTPSFSTDPALRQRCCILGVLRVEGVHFRTEWRS
jgi:hypothetical protein